MKFTNDFFSVSNTDPAAEFVQLVDSNSFEIFVFKKVTLWIDGQTIIGKPVDGVIFIRKGGSDIYYQRIFDSSVNVKWFGVKDREEENADQSAKIQKCIDTSYDLLRHQRIIKNGIEIDNDLGGEFFTASIPIYFPKGKYVITDKIILQNGTVLRGENKNCVEFVSPHHDTIGFTTLRYILDTHYAMSNQVGIENITFNQIGIELFGAVKSYIKDCNFMNCNNITAILLKLSVNIVIEDVHIRGNPAGAGGGISIIKDVGNGPNTTIRMNRVWIQSCRTGIYISSNSGLGNALDSSSLTNSIIEYCTIGIYMEGRINNLNINDLHFEMLEQAAIVSTAIGTVSLSELWFDISEEATFGKVGNIVLNSSDNSTVFHFYNVHTPIHIRQDYSGKVLLFGVGNIVENTSGVTPVLYQ